SIARTWACLEWDGMRFGCLARVSRPAAGSMQSSHALALFARLRALGRLTGHLGCVLDPNRGEAGRRETLITVWLEVRVLPARSPALTEISRDLTNPRGFAGAQSRLAVSIAPAALKLVLFDGPFSERCGLLCRLSLVLRERHPLANDLPAGLVV